VFCFSVGSDLGVHLGDRQEDLTASAGLLDRVRRAGIRLGVSTHTYAELARALALRPSYVSLGPVFPTTSKELRYQPQGLQNIRRWKALVGDRPLVAIGGISLDTAPQCLEMGADSISVISAVTASKDLAKDVSRWQALWGPPLWFVQIREHIMRASGEREE
jgi:thiamine-phosphate diphosphorylase